MGNNAFNVFIGYDPGEDAAAQICKASLLKHASIPLNVTFLNQTSLRHAGLYGRPSYWVNDQRYDGIDGKPYSTEFSFSRFLVPSLMQYGQAGQKWALFCDSDMLWRGDIADLFEAHDIRERAPYGGRAVYVVQHEYDPEPGTKMRFGLKQEPYYRKNWSSFMLFNTAHPACQVLLPYIVSTKSGRWLHTLQWCRDEDIGMLLPEWNWLEGHSTDDNPKVVHFTRGTPDIPAYSKVEYADEWLQYWSELK